MSNFYTRLSNRARDLLYLRGLEGWHLAGNRGRVFCYLYHRVVKEDHYAFLTEGGLPATSHEELREDLSFLRRLGAEFFTFRDILNGLFPKPDQFGAIISFDDCLRDNYTTGMEVLSELEVPAVFFQTSSLVDRVDWLWEHAIYWYQRDDACRQRFAKIAREEAVSHGGLPPTPPSGDWGSFIRDAAPFDLTERVLGRAGRDDLLHGAPPDLPGKLYPSRRDLLRAQEIGHEIGSHGHRHLKRVNVSESAFEDDLRQSRESLAEILGRPPASYSFPFSSFLPDDGKICQKYFRLAATVERYGGITSDTDLFRVPRFTWPGPARNRLRQRRWLLTGVI